MAMSMVGGEVVMAMSVVGGRGGDYNVDVRGGKVAMAMVGAEKW